LEMLDAVQALLVKYPEAAIAPKNK
jgi:hypothetical protein